MTNKASLRAAGGASRGAVESYQAEVRHREPDAAILEHEQKRKVEVACLELAANDGGRGG